MLLRQSAQCGDNMSSVHDGILRFDISIIIELLDTVNHPVTTALTKKVIPAAMRVAITSSRMAIEVRPRLSSQP